MNKAIFAVKVVLYPDEFIVRRQFIHKVIFSAAIIIKKIVTPLVVENGHFLLLSLPFYSFYALLPC